MNERRPADDATEPLNLSDRDAVRTWLTQMHAQIKDAVTAGEDATRAPGEREFGRRAARRRLVKARGALDQLVRAAKRGLS